MVMVVLEVSIEHAGVPKVEGSLGNILPTPDAGPVLLGPVLCGCGEVAHGSVHCSAHRLIRRLMDKLMRAERSPFHNPTLPNLPLAPWSDSPPPMNHDLDASLVRHGRRRDGPDLRQPCRHVGSACGLDEDDLLPDWIEADDVHEGKQIHPALDPPVPMLRDPACVATGAEEFE